MSEINVKVFEQLEEIRSSGSVNMAADIQGIKRLAEELGFDELFSACCRIASKDRWERARDFAALMKAFGEWLEKIRAEPDEDGDENDPDEDPNAGKGDETPEPVSEGGTVASGPDYPGTETPEPGLVIPGVQGGAYTGVDEASDPDESVEVPVVYGEHKPDVNVDPEITVEAKDENEEVVDAEVNFDEAGEPIVHGEPGDSGTDIRKLNEKDEE